MQSMPAAEYTAMHLYEYAIIRLVPDIERGEMLNVGLAMMCKRRRWIKVAIDFDRSIAALLTPACDLDDVEMQLQAMADVAAGKTDSPIATLEPHERFRWLTAVRSACITCSRPHPGKSHCLDETFEKLFTRLIKH